MAQDKKKPSNKPQDYQALRTVWYKKLERSGFEDIEKDEHNLKRWSSWFNHKVMLKSWMSRSEYYRLADQFLHNYKFESNLEKVIWEYHTNAISVRDIATTLNKTRALKKTNKDKVLAVIKKLKTEMKRMYLPGYEE